MKKGFIVRQKSLNSLPSKQFARTTNEFKNQKSIIQHKSKYNQHEDVLKLKQNLNFAMELASNEAVASSRAKEENMRNTRTKLHIEQKYNTISTQLYEEKEKFAKLQTKITDLEEQIQKRKQSENKLNQSLKQINSQAKTLKEELKEMERVKKKLEEMETQKNRIIILENQLRNEKLHNDDLNKGKKELEKKITELQHQVKMTKPYQQELQQRIGYLERVNLELERKMEDFHRKEHDFRKELEHWKNAHTKMTNDRNKFKTNYETTKKTLEEKLVYISELEAQIEDKHNQIVDLTEKLENKTKRCSDLENELLATKDYYKSVMDENAYLSKRNKALQQFEDENRRTLASHIKVADETNIYIVNRNSSIAKIQNQNKELHQLLDTLEEKFTKLDKLFEEGSLRGQGEIKESFYSVIRQNDKLKLELREMKDDFEEAVLKYGEERDILQRLVNLYELPMPNQEHLFQALIADKTEEIIMLEASNDQLIKIKKESEERITNLEKQNEKLQKEMYNLRLKAADLFKAKKDLEEARATMNRYQEMIEESKGTINDLNAQTEILRSRISEISDKNFNYDLENRNLTFKLQELENIMKELDIKYLNAKKIQNEKNAHVLVDSIEKMENGINSLAYYFSCCFCGELMPVPITLAPCGHNYCANCKDAYAQFCYECDTGQPIEKVYQSKFLKETTAKYKFLLMVLKEAKNNLITIEL